MTTNELRKALTDIFNEHSFDILDDGSIRVYGTMPNTNMEGWYLFGYVGNRQTEELIANLVGE